MSALPDARNNTTLRDLIDDVEHRATTSRPRPSRSWRTPHGSAIPKGDAEFAYKVADAMLAEREKS